MLSEHMMAVQTNVALFLDPDILVVSARRSMDNLPNVRDHSPPVEIDKPRLSGPEDEEEDEEEDETTVVDVVSPSAVVDLVSPFDSAGNLILSPSSPAAVKQLSELFEKSKHVSDVNCSSIDLTILRQIFPSVIRGTLYATGCTAGTMVNVPAMYGTFEAPTFDCFRTDLWVPRLDPDGTISTNLIDHASGRLTVTKYPFGTGCALLHPFEIFYLPQEPVYFSNANRNNAIRVYTDRAPRPYFGNILVMKWVYRKPVIRVDKEDKRLIDAIVASYVSPHTADPLLTHSTVPLRMVYSTDKTINYPYVNHFIICAPTSMPFLFMDVSQKFTYLLLTAAALSIFRLYTQYTY